MMGARKLVLVYHSFCSEIVSEAPDRYVGRHRSMPVHLLEAQLNWLSRFADFVTLDDIASVETPRRWKVAVTLDDGYRNNLSLALPVFEQHEVPVTWFVCTGFVEQDRLPWWDLMDYVIEKVRSPVRIEVGSEQYGFDLSDATDRFRLRRLGQRWFLEAPSSVAQTVRTQLEESVTEPLPSNAFANRAEVTEAVRSPWLSIGGHTVTHPNMARHSFEDLRREVKGGKHQLEEWTGQPIRWFAYPYGGTAHWNPDAKRIVREAGFEGAVTTVRAYAGQAKDRFEIPRLTMPNDPSVWKMKAWVLATNTCRELLQLKQKWIG